MFFKGNRLLLETMPLQYLAATANRIEAETGLRRGIRLLSRKWFKFEALRPLSVNSLSTVQIDVSSTALNLQAFESFSEERIWKA